MRESGGGMWMILLGPSGAGKLRCAQMLQDSGYAPLIGLPVSALSNWKEQRDLVIVPRMESERDVTSFLTSLPLLTASHRVQTICFQATAEELACRLKAERRRHPDQDGGKTLLEACQTELQRLQPLQDAASRRIPCWPYESGAQRRACLTHLQLPNRRMLIRILSFSFRHGAPLEADLVLDVRCLPNPYYDSRLRNGTGLDEDVSAFILSTEQARCFLKKWLAFLEEATHQYETEGKRELVLAIGCTGGRHRSVAVAACVQAFLSQRGYTCLVRHLELSGSSDACVHGNGGSICPFLPK